MKVDLKNTGKSFGELVGRFDLGEPNINRLHAIARDLLADNQQIIEPILGLISRPDFRPILQRAGSGEGVIQRHALMADLRQIYTSHVVDQISLFVDGILGIDSEVDAPSREYETCPQKEDSFVLDDECCQDAIFVFEDSSTKCSYDELDAKQLETRAGIQKGQQIANQNSANPSLGWMAINSSNGTLSLTTKGIIYNTKSAVSKYTGKPENEVQIAMDQLGCNEPFDFVVADRLAYLLTGDPSIWRAHARLHKGQYNTSLRAGSNQIFPNIYSCQISMASRNENKYSNSAASATKRISYGTKTEISICTGRSEKDVQEAIDQLKCKEPFDLVTADRLAYILTGDPSIRRAYLSRKGNSV